jgi:hypothetical protein
MGQASILKGCGWRLVVGTVGPGRASNDFQAVYNGEDLRVPRKGVVAVVATATGAWEAAQIAVNGFAEGYYGLGGTLSAGRAAAQALSSINTWLFRQSQDGAGGHEMQAALAAVLFVNRRIDIVQAGDCAVFVYHRGTLIPLTGDGVGGTTPRVGAEAALRIEHYEYETEPGDRFVLLGSAAASYADKIGLAGALAGPTDAQDLAERLSAALRATGPGADGAVTVVDVIEPAHLAYEDIAARFAALPLRKPPREGDLWDGFRIGRTVNRGRYTLLKRAYDEIEKRDVVLKIPLSSMLADQVFRAGFLREVWIGTAVDVPGVARYIALPPGRQSCLYLVIPFYRGETLEKRLKRLPKLSLGEGIGIALKLAAAVGELTRRDIIHRDIKPENVMLTAGGEAVLLDLGLAYLTGLDDGEADNAGGTTRYMAPELFSGVAANARTEVFSLSVTIYRMFSGGRFPFGQYERTPLRRLRPDLPAWLGGVLQRGLAMEPAERFPDADALSKALEAGLTGADMRPAGRLGRLIAPTRLWQAATAFFATATLLLLLTGWRP